ncbi:hypothetical protein CEXT_488291 [Caerostris extrusa]|uniref:Uncharacterized protein n=1 Tax=Caerostris extrusa TaxID=172846 RepID=A0AAV4XG01_CAEEX|nr:hypothetical protein CEXT_488291 [Caerostris extrusa]
MSKPSIRISDKSIVVINNKRSWLCENANDLSRPYRSGVNITENILVLHCLDASEDISESSLISHCSLRRRNQRNLCCKTVLNFPSKVFCEITHGDESRC